eukprot:CAMPEP_0184862662 /NCGR_PEP_ID=MMETSP0580-20130426/7086_1 /TAXON_ID=1118495 /ORGANISM="Dactyliosolen fragilissimus" /LENGTH=771 /DNA_ID=CAMNT_0027360615 /DNA_START=23 /DNA_END=2338 /DNA_ORIENTATION=-
MSPGVEMLTLAVVCIFSSRLFETSTAFTVPRPILSYQKWSISEIASYNKQKKISIVNASVDSKTDIDSKNNDSNSKDDLDPKAVTKIDTETETETEIKFKIKSDSKKGIADLIVEDDSNNKTATTSTSKVTSKVDAVSKTDVNLKANFFSKDGKDSDSEVASSKVDIDSNKEVSPKMDSSAPEPTASNPIGSTEVYSKLRRLKDRMWVREALEDLTAAEFACSIAQPKQGKQEEGKQEKKKTSVDFEKLLSKLDRRVEDICLRATYREAHDEGLRCYPTELDGISSNETPKPDMECYLYKPNAGMGSVTYTDEQREALLLRIIDSRQRIVETMSGRVASMDSAGEGDLDEIRDKLKSSDQPAEVSVNTDKKVAGDPALYVRDDGTIDWDGALQDAAALQKFGTSVWARINGQDPETVNEDSVKLAGGYSEKEAVTVKIVETDEIREKKEKLDKLKKDVKIIEGEHTALLNSAVAVGSAVANVNLATLNPELRNRIRNSYDNLSRKKIELSFNVLNYELERIYTYLDNELGNTSTKGYIPLQDRLNVAEFGLIESQVETLNSQIRNREDVDEDVLSVVLDQTVDLKRRLGIDFYVQGLTFDREAIVIWLNDQLSKAKKGLAFYGKGCQLFWNDVVFSSSLVTRALQGYTLKPREVQTLRRTFKDIITFIPVVIILIIPLSPVGHVFVFGAIQRFFPDFFPSCFTERRQNLLSLYESTEFKALTIDENWQEKIKRISGASAYLIADNARKLYRQVIGPEDKGKDASDEKSEDR